MTERPRCAYCGKPAPKLTTTVWVCRSDSYPVPSGSWSRRIYLDRLPRNMDECRQHTNQQIVSIKYNINGTVSRFSEWDGESYWLPKDPCCTNDCAKFFARAAYKAGYRMVEATKVTA